MAHLILKFKDLILKEVALKEKGVTIGRELGNDIVVENLLVSGYHARVDEAGKDFVLTDLQSKNGTSVNGERVTSAKLKSGDEILVGKHTIVFTLDPEEEAAKQDLVEATMFLDVGKVDAGKEAAKPLTGPGPDSELDSGAPPIEKMGVISMLSGGSEEFEISKKLVKIGKGGEADLHVGGFLTPKVAATISMRPTGYHLTPMGRAKVKVNGAQVKGSYRLKEFDTIEIGPARMQFYYKS